MARQHCLYVLDLAGDDVVLQHCEDSARRVFRVDRAYVIQSGRDGCEEFILVAQSVGFSGGVMPLIIIQPAH